jgi:hypothetical protein
MKLNILPHATLAFAILTGLPGNADAQSCQIYSEDFSSAGGPADLDDGTYKVQWCLDGGTVGASPTCMSGNALRTSNQFDDPRIWVFVGSEGCSQVTLSFRYAQDSFTGTELLFESSNDSFGSCFKIPNSTAQLLSTTGSACQTVSFTASVAGQQSIYFAFDHNGSNGDAIFIDDVTITVEGCDCAGTGGPGGDCLTSFEADFGSLNLSPPVCDLFPELFESCEGTAPPFVTGSTPCGTSADMVMGLGNGGSFGSFSAVVTRCIDLSGYTTPALEFEYYKTTGQLGPQIEARVAGGPWTEVWKAPLFTNASSSSCFFDCLDLSAYAGLSDVQFRIGASDSSATQHAFDDIKLVDMPIAAGSFTPYFGTGTAPGNILDLSGTVINGSGNGPGIGDRIRLETQVTGSTGAWTGMFFAPSAIPYLDVEILVDLNTLVEIFIATQDSPGSPTSSYSFDIPPLSPLVGATLYFQSLRFVAGGFTLSNGLEVKLGC